jgi:hypothetical protein
VFDAEWHRYNEKFVAVHAADFDRVAPQPRLVARIAYADIETAAKDVDERRVAELTLQLRAPAAGPA